jgi:hypothetical protein
VGLGACGGALISADRNRDAVSVSFTTRKGGDICIYEDVFGHNWPA